MDNNFTNTVLGNTGLKVHRLGFAASYRPGKEAVYKAFDSGINLFFGFGIDTNLTKALREIVKNNREKIIIATGAYNTFARFQNVRKALEKRLRQFGTDYIDIFMDLGIMKPKHFPEKIRDEMYKLKDEGKCKFTGISCHDRKFVGQLAGNGTLDTVMMRYNAAHRGAEEDIFPYVKTYNTGVISYTATRWTYLIRKQKGWDETAIPTAGQCYRFVLSNPNVHVCLTAPRNIKQLEENLKSLDDGPLNEEEMCFIKKYGDLIHSKKKWFM